MRILVTGGLGFIGSNFLQYYCVTTNKNFVNGDIFVLDKLGIGSNRELIETYQSFLNIKFIFSNLIDIFQLENLHDVDLVLNLAAESHVDRSINSPKDFYLNNVLGGLELFEFIRKNKEIRCLNVSTDEVYGEVPVGFSEENSRLNPSSPYSASKASIDLLAQAYNRTYGTKIKTLRLCNNFGPWQAKEKVIPYFISSILKDSSVSIYGDGNQIREWMYVGDTCKVIDSAIKRFDELPEILNVGSNFRISNNELVDFIERELSLNVVRNYVKDRQGHDRRYALNSSLSNQLLEYQVSDFNRNLFDTVVWYKNRFTSKVERK